VADKRATLKWMEMFAQNKTFVHKISPVTLFLITIIYIITLITFEMDDLTGMVPLLLYPLVMIIMSEIPIKLLSKIIIPLIPFAILLGISYPFYDKTAVEVMPGVSIGRGWITGSALIFRFMLTVMGAILFMAVSGINGLTYAMQTLRFPKVFIAIFSFTYWYIHTLQ